MAKRHINRRQMLWAMLGAILNTNSGCRRTGRAKAIHKVINYSNTRNGVFYYGTISDLDGTIRSTWLCNKGGRQTDLEQLIDDETFQFLCDGVNNYPVFEKHPGPDIETRLDFSNFHIVAFSLTEDSFVHMRVFMIPVE